MISSTERDAGVTAIEGVSFVLPCLNEGVTLEICLRKAFAAIAELGLPAEVVVADNGSTDRSTTIARTLGCTVVPVVQRGYGAALLAGLRAAKYSYIVMGDADDSYDFREAPRLVAELRAGSESVHWLALARRDHARRDALAKSPHRNTHVDRARQCRVRSAL